MKKSQILAAIALAMALGVVAPVAVAENASATVVEGKTNAQYVADEVAKMKDEFGTITTYNSDGSGSTVINNGYTYYGQVNTKLTNVETQLKLIDDAGRNSLMAAGALGTVNAAPFTNYLSTETKTKLANANGEIKTYADAKALAATIVTELGAKTEASVDTTVYNQLQAKIADIKDTPSTNYLAAAQTAVNVAAAAHKNDAAVSAIRAEVKALTGTEPAAPTTLAEYNSIISTVTSKFPKMAAYRRVSEELTKSHIADVDFNAGSYNDRQIKELVSNMWAAYNGTTITTPSDQIVGDKNDGVNAPATGVAGTAEGTATTVSIVAGLATALTALGAGVVAYRSARRK